MRAPLLSATLLLLPLLPAAAQSGRWVIAPQVGVATSLDAGQDAPGAGPSASLFVGRRLGSALALGVQGGWHRSADGTASRGVGACPGPILGTDCVGRSDVRLDVVQVGAAIRFTPAAGRWRPVLQFGGGYYATSERNAVSYEYVNDPSPVPPEWNFTIERDEDGFGGHGGIGLEFAPGDGRFTVGAGAQLHGYIITSGGEGTPRTILTIGLQGQLAF